jgi:hypothetical protein
LVLISSKRNLATFTGVNLYVTVRRSYMSVRHYGMRYVTMCPCYEMCCNDWMLRYCSWLHCVVTHVMKFYNVIFVRYSQKYCMWYRVTSCSGN